MKAFVAVVVLSVLGTTLAGPVGSAETDFYTTDPQGGYHFGYNTGRVAHQEQRAADGVVRGAYSFVDSDGQIQVVTYTADNVNGFLVSGSNIPRVGPIPVPGESGNVIEEAPSAVVQDTPEVVAARAAHSEAYKQILARNGQGIQSIPAQVSVPVVQYHPDYAPYVSL